MKNYFWVVLVDDCVFKVVLILSYEIFYINRILNFFRMKRVIEIFSFVDEIFWIEVIKMFFILYMFSFICWYEIVRFYEKVWLLL